MKNQKERKFFFLTLLYIYSFERRGKVLRKRLPVTIHELNILWNTLSRSRHATPLKTMEGFQTIRKMHPLST